jgi:pantoate--beta-alanine ligase
MIVVRTAAALRAELRSLTRGGRRIGFVPTMGALHDGHLSLVRAAASACDVVVMSIFVNPLQFGPREDLDAYPRDEAADLELAEGRGVDVVFCPSISEMYPEEAVTTVTVGPLADVLEGEVRPGHFAGVATVLTKLFNIVTPDAAFFGQKDAQQVAVVRQMAADLFFDIDIVVCPTVRAPDGVALSTRNRYLSAAERQRATTLARALEAGQRALGEGRDLEAVKAKMWDVLVSEEGVRPDYAAAVDPSSFGPPLAPGPILLAVAARVGSTRLIDNRLVDPGGLEAG